MGYSAEDQFSQQAGHYSITDLRMIACALGFPSDSLESCVPSGSFNKGGVCSKELRRLLDLGYFTSAFHFTYNMKSGLYNVKLILKCLDLLDRSALSFHDIREANVAFSAYEHIDQKGVRSDTNILLKVIKMCGFVVSQQKLSMYLRQKEPTYVENGRVQLYEFLEMLAICEPRKKFSVQEKRVQSTDKTSRGVYQMDDMRTSMLTPDEKLSRHLNWRFQHVDSWMLPKETIAVVKSISSSKLQQTENLNGTRPQHPKSKSDCSLVDPTEDTWTLVTPVPQLRCHCYMPKRVSPIISEQDIKNTQNNIEELLYQIGTLDEKSHWDLNWRLDYYLPGYRERSSARQKNVEPQPAQCHKKGKNTDVFQRLYAQRRRLPSPCHAMTCDAFKLGIGKKNEHKRPECSRSSISGKRKALPLRSSTTPNK
ncbi:uncharacterized protein [Aquarana catesbeiana]|uniref:uncharacterized protein n=1 Tax=Aquarana catesbeiana TaxID=8400 RepID=UPI003CC97D69